MSARREASAAARIERATGGDILRGATPRAWVEAALADLPTLLVDHANCEKKAASTALALIFGTESMIVFSDVLGLDEKAARKVKSWAARALVRAAANESRGRR